MLDRAQVDNLRSMRPTEQEGEYKQVDVNYNMDER